MRISKEKILGGFSIIEVVIAIAILAMASVAPLSLSQKGLRSSVYARDQVTAFYLAQEAIEYVRYVRDNNSLAGLSQSENWLTGLENCISPSICGIDVNAIVSERTYSCANDHPANGVTMDCLLTYNPNTGIYGDQRDGSGNPISPAENTLFKRKVTITQSAIGSDPHAAGDISVTVSWQTGSISQSVVVKEKIYDWYPKP